MIHTSYHGPKIPVSENLKLGRGERKYIDCCLWETLTSPCMGPQEYELFRDTFLSTPLPAPPPPLPGAERSHPHLKMAFENLPLGKKKTQTSQEQCL